MEVTWKILVQLDEPGGNMDTYPASKRGNQWVMTQGMEDGIHGKRLKIILYLNTKVRTDPLEASHCVRSLHGGMHR